MKVFSCNWFVKQHSSPSSLRTIVVATHPPFTLPRLPDTSWKSYSASTFKARKIKCIKWHHMLEGLLISPGGYENNGGPQSSGMGYGNMDRRSHGGNYGNTTNNLYEQQRLGSRENRQSTFSAAGRANVSSNMWSTSSGSANMQMQQHQASLANNSQRKQSYSHASNLQVQSLDSMVSANAFANGSNQNSGNMMTGRSSTRRIAAPGGNSSLSLGWSGGHWC